MLRENERLEKMLNDGEKISKSVSEIYYENYLICNQITETENSMNDHMKMNKDSLFGRFVFDFYKKLIWKKELMRLFGN